MIPVTSHTGNIPFTFRFRFCAGTASFGNWRNPGIGHDSDLEIRITKRRTCIWIGPAFPGGDWGSLRMIFMAVGVGEQEMARSRRAPKDLESAEFMVIFATCLILLSLDITE